MSKDSNSLELSEFFDNDDSDGYRLAEFLQKRRGCVQRQNFLFMNCEPVRLSVDVQVEKAPEKVDNDKERKQQAHQESESTPIQNIEENPGREDANSDGAGIPQAPPSPSSKHSRSKPTSPLQQSKKSSPRFSAAVRKSGGCSPGDHLRRYSLKRLSRLSGRRTLLHEFESTVTDSGFAPNMCSTPLSPEKRTYTVERGEKPGQVVLTPEFPRATQINSHIQCRQSRDNDTNTSPRSAGQIGLANGTSHLQRTVSPNASLSRLQSRLSRNHDANTSPSREKQIGPNNKSQIFPSYSPSAALSRLQSRFSRNNNVTTSPSRIGNTGSYNGPQVWPQIASPRAALQNLEESSRNVLKEIIQCNSERSSPKRRLSPEESVMVQTNGSAMDISLRSQNLSCSANKKVRSPKNSTSNRSQITIRVESPRSSQNSSFIHSETAKANRVMTQELSMNLKSGKNQILLSQPEGEIPSTQHVDISVADIGANNDESIIPETQDAGTDVDNCITIQSMSKVVVIPISQTFNNTLSAVPQSLEKTTTGEKTNASKAGKSVSAVDEEVNTAQKQTDHTVDATDNLKLTDIMTDDEEPTAVAMSPQTVENNSQAPLNLASNTNNTRTKRLRKRSVSRRRLEMERSQVASTETETELPPLDLNQMVTRKRNSRKKQIPLNKAPGTPLNGERFALELARMSNYEILDLRKRNSMGRVFPINGRKSVRSKGQAIKKQIQLDDEIELELIRRNMDASKNDASQCIPASDLVDAAELYPPVPDEFRDVLPESSLIDEKSCDRVSFRTRRSSQKQKDVRTKMLPEVLQHYLEVSNRFVQKKKSVTQPRSKPRTLYTQGLSDSEDRTLNSSQERNISYKSAKESLPYVPSPPKSDSDHMPSLKVVSPPPPLQTQLADSPVTFIQPIEQSLPPPPPPPQFGSDSGIESNVTTTIERNTSTSGDVFKKPLLAPIKKRRGKKNASKCSPDIVTPSDAPLESDNSEENTSNTGTTNTSSNSTLRRSKRGHVPLKNSTPLFQLLFQKVLCSNEKNQARVKKRLLENSKAVSRNASTVSSGKLTSTRARKGPLATVSENDVLEEATKTSKVKRKAKAKGVKDSSKGKKDENDEALECSHIKMSKPPPLDHFNNVFDNLRSTTSTETMTSENEHYQYENPIKEKKLIVRVARVKQPALDKARVDHPGDTLVSRSKEAPTSTRSNIQKSSMESSSVSSSGDTNNSNFELLSWLKNITYTENIPRNDEIFKEMRISSASSLCFTELQGVEYAFYDTDDKASLGYLRFKPRQIKPRKRAKKYHLHFVTLVGNFRITANDKERNVGPGDMVAIEKSVYYDIENLSDDIGILMVIKK